MINKLLHTPEGFRDVYGTEFLKKNIVKNILNDKIKEYKYMNIETPTVEFFDVFSSNIGTIPSKELYKFFDKEGNTLVLRPDFTPSIARVAATYFADYKEPLRFMYSGNTFVNNGLNSQVLCITSFNQKLSEYGAKLFNIAVTAGVILALNGERFSISHSNLASLAIGVFFGGVDEWPPLDLAENFKSP